MLPPSNNLRRRLLLIEDDPSLRMMFHRMLEAAGIEVVASDSAEAAADHIQLGQFECALIDCQLPGRSGIQVVADLLGRSDQI